jgi:hypothetical protein
MIKKYELGGLTVLCMKNTKGKAHGIMNPDTFINYSTAFSSYDSAYASNKLN